MNNKRILLVEDEEITGELLQEMILECDYEVTWCRNGNEALECYKDKHYPVILTDIEMPEMDGNELISHIRNLNDKQIIIVHSVRNDSEIIIDIMKKGVYDYLIKPINRQRLIDKLERAFEAAEMRSFKSALERERILKLQNQLEWFKWNEDIITRDYERVDKSLFQSLHNSFNQGAGFGALLTLISILSNSVKKQGESYLIDAGMFDLIQDNALTAEKTLKTFSDINYIMSNDIETETISLTDLHTFISTIIKDLKEYTNIKNQSILLCDSNPNFDSTSLQVNSDFLYKATYELLMNAIKFSEDKSSIAVIMYIDDGQAAISILNSPEKSKNDIIGIPIEFENIVFEPFFRLSKQVYENYNSLDYGLGLTVTEKIINKHKGKISVSNITDYSDIKKGPTTKVMFTVLLPVNELQTVHPVEQDNKYNDQQVLSHKN